MKKLLLGLGLIAVLLSCGGNTPPANNISGTVRIASGLSGATAPFVPNEVLVKFESNITALRSAGLRVAGATLQNVRSLALENTVLMRSSDSDVQAVVQALEARADVIWAQPNYLVEPSAVPNDEFFNLQWHYPAINLPEAWDIETGDTNPVTVAVIDTGILSGHPDFVGKLLPGFDFISNPQTANDGNGRDNNPEDRVAGKYHGSHVAGTIAAAVNDAQGIAGVSWGAKILPVRALGATGSTSDIIDGMLWAVGLPVAGVQKNPNPAQVLNLSLGSSVLCAASPIYQDAINKVNAVGGIIVVAAGNANKDASQFSPASCSGVITVGATDFVSARAPYSNFGARIDVMAPGGNMSLSLANPKYPDGVLSVGRDDATAKFNVAFLQGTSMASPHVAGVVALMKSRDPSLSFARALDVLTRTARLLTPTKCTGSGTAKTSDDCGAGLIDAKAALLALSVGTTPPDFSLSLNPSSLLVQPSSSKQITLDVIGIGGFQDAVNITFRGAPTGITFTQSNNSTLTMNVAASVAVGTYNIAFQGTSGALVHKASLTLKVETNAIVGTTIAKTNILACLYDAATDNCDSKKSQVITLSGTGSSSDYNFSNAASGSYLMVAVKDVNNDQKIGNGDLVGLYTRDNNVAEVNPPASDIDISMFQVQSTGSFIQDSSVIKQQNAAIRFWNSR